MIHPTNDKRGWYRTEYLKSPHWLALRARKLERNPACEMCGSKKRVEPHHVNYRNIFDVTLDDLVSVCRRCHKKIHEFFDPEKIKASVAQQKTAEAKEIKLHRNQCCADAIKKLGHPMTGSPIQMSTKRTLMVTPAILRGKYRELLASVERLTLKAGLNVLGAEITLPMVSRLREEGFDISRVVRF